MNETSQNGDVGSVISLLNIHTLPQDNELIKLNEMHVSVESDYVNGDYCYNNSHTELLSKNQNSIDYRKKRDEISTNRYVRENNELLGRVEIDVMLPTSTLNQYFHM